jgi:hypothetical protein
MVESLDEKAGEEKKRRRKRREGRGVFLGRKEHALTLDVFISGLAGSTILPFRICNLGSLRLAI